MVSPSVSSPPKIPPLSYADRAKKAQNIRSPISLQPHRIVVQTVPSTSATSDSSSPFLTSPSKDSKLTLNPASVDYTPHFPPVPTSTVSSHPPTSPTVPSASLTNGVKHASKDLAEKALSIVAAHTKPLKSPVVNVWNVRKEQMAAARSPITASSHMSASQSVPLLPKPSFSHDQPTASSKPPRDSAPRYLHGPSASAATNGVPVVPPPVEYDPFVVRIFTEPTRVQIPSLPPSVDTNIWPEVGKLATASTSHPVVSGQAPDLTSNSREENQSSNGSGSEQLSAAASRKSEKTKWVPIPAEELQATADALIKADKRKTQSRKGSQHPPPQPRPNAQQQPRRSASGSRSAQAQSRLQSASQSASQSAVQSRSGSSQSSPRFPRGRRLPGDENTVTGVSGYAAPNRGSAGRSSGTSSPQVTAQQQLPPTHQSLSNLDNATAPAVHSGHYYGQGVPPPSVPYYPQTLHQPSSYLRSSPHPSHSGYPSGQSTPSSQPVSYPVYYIPYAPQQYVYWNGHSRSHPGSGHHSPAYPSPSYMQGGAVIPQHLPQFMQSHLQHQPYATRQRSETNPSIGMRPPPPHQSLPVGGYVVPLVGAATNGATGTGERPVVFGSIGVPGSSKCPSPAPTADGDDRTVVDEEKPFTTFSIGVGPGDAAPARVRSRTVSSKASARSRAATMSDAGSEVRPSVGAPVEEEEVKVIDLTDPQESKWEFGTVAVAAPPGLRDDAVGAVGSGDAAADGEEPRGDGGAVAAGYEPLPPVLTSIAGFGSPVRPSRSLGHSPLQQPQVLGTRSGSGTPSDQARPQETGLQSVLADESVDDEFEVKDFGYGFGPVSGTGFAETITRAERAQRQREHRYEVERERLIKEAQEREVALLEERELRDQARAAAAELEAGKAIRDADVSNRPRRGYYAGHERGGSGGYGGRRGRGMNGFGRGYSRRGGGGFQQHSRHAPPFSVTPPQAHFQPLIQMGEALNGLYAQPRPQLAAYIPTGYESFAQPQPPPPLNTATATQVTPPVPVPISPISFPLDPTRWYLLGQLEYYLSPQNMAQDFFLRQRMDSKGWVPISLIASFNRVRQLTVDMHLVRDVLILSSVVQVKDDWVRMSGWEKFVLPDAATSVVEIQEQGESGAQSIDIRENADYIPAEDDTITDALAHDAEEEGDTEVEMDLEEDDDEEDVVFVMDSEVTGSGLTWSPEKQT